MKLLIVVEQTASGFSAYSPDGPGCIATGASAMVLTLHARGLITREPGRPRSMRLLLGRRELPDLE